MTQYLLSMFQPQGDPPPPEALAPVMERLGALQKEMEEAGAWVFAGGLYGPESATVVRAGERDVLTTDGPFVEGKEYLGGFTVIEAPDLDAALGWARRQVEITGLPIEVRPFRF